MRKKKTVSVCITDEDLQKVKSLADQLGVSVSAAIGIVIRKAFRGVEDGEESNIDASV